MPWNLPQGEIEKVKSRCNRRRRPGMVHQRDRGRRTARQVAPFDRADAQIQLELLGQLADVEHRERTPYIPGALDFQKRRCELVDIVRESRTTSISGTRTTSAHGTGTTSVHRTRATAANETRTNRGNEIRPTPTSHQIPTTAAAEIRTTAADDNTGTSSRKTSRT